MSSSRFREWIAALALGVSMLACRGRIEETGGKPAPHTPSASIPPVEAADVPVRERRPASGSTPVVWLGLDGVDWEHLDRLSAEGKLPNWKRLTSEGFSARLQSFYPILSPLLWTTAATGLPPADHGVLDFQEVDPKTGRKVPISGFSRSAPAVWNLASAAGRRVGVVGWWATHPGEEVNGFFVSDHASPILFSSPSLAGTAYPASLVPGLEQTVRTDGHVGPEDLVSYLGIAPSEIASALRSGSGKGLEDPVIALSRILGATRVTQRIARGLYDRDRPDLTAVHFEGPTKSRTSSRPLRRRGLPAPRTPMPRDTDGWSRPTTRRWTGSWGSGCGERSRDYAETRGRRLARPPSKEPRLRA